MTKKLHEGLDFDALFADAKTQTVDVPDTLMAKILADAEEVQKQGITKSPDVRAPWWRGVVDQLGGWQAVGTFATCAVFGLYIGYASPTEILSGFSATSEAALEDGFSVASEFELSLLEG